MNYAPILLQTTENEGGNVEQTKSRIHQRAVNILPEDARAAAAAFYAGVLGPGRLDLIRRGTNFDSLWLDEDEVLPDVAIRVQVGPPLLSNIPPTSLTDLRCTGRTFFAVPDSPTREAESTDWTAPPAEEPIGGLTETEEVSDATRRPLVRGGKVGTWTIESILRLWAISSK